MRLVLWPVGVSLISVTEREALLCPIPEKSDLGLDRKAM